MLDISNIECNTSPFSWFKVALPISDELRKNLLESYPSRGYELCTKSSGEKPYYMNLLKVYKSKHYNHIESFRDSPWHDFFLYLISDVYVDKIHAVTNDSRVLAKNIEINLWDYPQGGFLAPHLDKDEKVLSQLFYFNEHWERRWGGSLRLLRSADINDVGEEIFPDNTASFILPQSNTSWHAVTAQNSPENIIRRVLQIIFWEEKG